MPAADSRSFGQERKVARDSPAAAQASGQRCLASFAARAVFVRSFSILVRAGNWENSPMNQWIESACCGVVMRRCLFPCNTLGIMKTLLIGSLAAVAIVPSANAAESREFVIACPASIETTQQLRNPVPAGWLQVADVVERDSAKRWMNTHRLRGISFSDGHPSDLVTLVPDNPNEYGRGRKFAQRWTLIDSKGLYATCSYDQTTVELTRPIPSGYKVCEVRYEKNPSIELLGALCFK